MSAPVGIRVEKRFRHPRERVFDAFVDPSRVGDWLFHTPDGAMERTDYDPRPAAPSPSSNGAAASWRGISGGSSRSSGRGASCSTSGSRKRPRSRRG